MPVNIVGCNVSGNAIGRSFVRLHDYYMSRLKGVQVSRYREIFFTNPRATTANSHTALGQVATARIFI